MAYFLSAILIVMNVFWLGFAFFGLPGNWLIVISTCLFAWWRAEDQIFSIYTLLAIVILAILGEVVEFFAGLAGARKAGAGLRGSFGALIGLFAGAILGTLLIPIPFLGTLIGCCVGAGFGAWAMEVSAGRSMEQSFRSGFGAGLGTLAGTTTKIALGVLIWMIVAVAAFWP